MMIFDEPITPRYAGASTIRGRAFLGVLGLLGPLLALPGVARAQAADCVGLRAEIAAARQADGVGRFDMALRQQRDEIARTRAYADDSGCSGAGFFDDPDSAACRGLARRTRQLEIGLQRLEDQASRGAAEAEDRRRALTEQFAAECPAESAGGSPEVDAPEGTTAMPVDPDAPPAEAPRAKVAQVLCVRHCDGAYYPLAVDVATDRMGDMDRICRAQCPAAESSAYAGRDGEDVSRALAQDGTTYAALPAAFKFRSGTTPACACRATGQTWAEALAGAEAILEQRKGDVTVTPALAAAMARPIPSPAPSSPKAAAPKPAASRPPAVAARPARKPDPTLAIPAPDPGGIPDAARDLTREFRRSAPMP